MSRGGRWLALAAMCAVVAVGLLDTTILNVASPTIRRELSTRSTLEGRSGDHDVHW
jgi:hypothetical protein